MKKTIKNRFLEHLRKRPNISSACEAFKISRQTVYRWKKEDEKFAISFDIALSEGDDHQNDFAENGLMLKIKDGHFPAIKYHLEKRHPKYMDKKINTVVVSPIEKNELDKKFKEIDSEYFEVPDNVDELLKGDEIKPAQ